MSVFVFNYIAGSRFRGFPAPCSCLVMVLNLSHGLTDSGVDFFYYNHFTTRFINVTSADDSSSSLRKPNLSE